MPQRTPFKPELEEGRAFRNHYFVRKHPNRLGKTKRPVIISVKSPRGGNRAVRGLVRYICDRGDAALIRTRDGVHDLSTLDGMEAFLHTWDNMEPGWKYKNDVAHIVIGSLNDEDQTAFVRTTEQWIAETFWDRDHVYAYHHPEDEIYHRLQKPAPKHPHIHLVACYSDDYRQENGRCGRLNHHGVVLDNWRARYAEIGAEHGLDLEPRRRHDRGLDRSAREENSRNFHMDREREREHSQQHES